MDDQKRLKILLVNDTYQVDVDYLAEYSKKPQSLTERHQGPRSNLPWVEFRLNGAYVIAHVLRERGHFVEILEYFSKMRGSEFADWFNFFQDLKFDVIGISATFSTKETLQKMVSFMKSLWPDATVMVGAQNSPPPCGADYYCLGYSERAMVEILDYHFYNKKGLKWLPYHGGKIIDANTFYPLHLDPPESREYYYKLYDQDMWGIKGQISPSFEISRGCRFKCKYCDFPLIGLKEDTATTTESIYRFLQEAYDNFGYTNFFITDDTCNNHNQQLVNLRDAVKKLGFTPRFYGMCRADLFKSNPIQLELMAESGFVYHYYGIETFNKKAGSVVGKGMDPDKMKELLINTRNYFMDNGLKEYGGTIGLIHGLPETNESFQEGWDWAINEFCVRDGVFNASSVPVCSHLVIYKSQNELTNLSAFGEDLTKYGYEIMSKEEYLEYLEENKDQYNSWQQQKVKEILQYIGIHGLPWKNQYTNFIESGLIVESNIRQLIQRYDLNDGIGEVGDLDPNTAVSGNFHARLTNNLFKRVSFSLTPQDYTPPNDFYTNYFRSKKMWRHMNKNLIPF